jgi:hypothetical protein
MDIYYAAGLFMSVNFRRFPVVEHGRIVSAILASTSACRATP